MKDINILAIQGGHNATAGLLQNGKIIAIISEERFTRIKNCSDFPLKSINWLLKYAKITAQDLDAVAFCGKSVILPLSKSLSTEPKVSLIRRIYGAMEYKNNVLFKPIIALKKLFDQDQFHHTLETGKAILWKEFRIPSNKIYFVDHHTCHAFSSYFGQTFQNQKSIILTLDGEGDDSCSTVSYGLKKDIRRIASTPNAHSLGYIYSITTKFMGMTPLEHEYKVMGLAPYATQKDKKYFIKTYDKIFKNMIWLDKKNPLIFNSRFPTNRFDHWLKEKAVGERFDNIAGAVQHLTEDLVCKWVKAVNEKTKISNFYAGGGVFMNVKMNMLLADMPEVKKLHVLPSCGDESNPIGAAYYVYQKLCEERGEKQNFHPIKDLYLGPSYDDEIEDYIQKNKLKSKYKIQKANAKMIAKMLAKGEIVARCVGRMEWGARSLGNRCIMANPSDLRYVWQINEQIKMRDFWMPFAPTILKEREHDYIENPKNIEAPYMIMAFRSTELAKKELRAAMHQADFTLRPQILERSWNPEYYDIIKEFEKITGIGGILNTSFNLHGKPIVMTPDDAVKETFENSGLRHLLLGKYLISKK